MPVEDLDSIIALQRKWVSVSQVNIALSKDAGLLKSTERHPLRERQVLGFAEVKAVVEFALIGSYAGSLSSFGLSTARSGYSVLPPSPLRHTCVGKQYRFSLNST